MKKTAIKIRKDKIKEIEAKGTLTEDDKREIRRLENGIIEGEMEGG